MKRNLMLALIGGCVALVRGVDLTTAAAEEETKVCLSGECGGDSTVSAEACTDCDEDKINRDLTTISHLLIPTEKDAVVTSSLVDAAKEDQEEKISEQEENIDAAVF